MESAKQVAIVLAAIAAGFLAAQGTKSKPTVVVAPATPVAAEAPPAAEAVKCACSGDCECDPCVCKEPDECNPPKVSAEPKLTQPCQQCGGDGLLDTPYGPVLCPTCGQGKSADVPKFTEPALYTQPQPSEYVTVRQSYRYGVFGRRTGYRNVTMTRAAYEAQQAQQTYSGSGCAGGRCGR